MLLLPQPQSLRAPFQPSGQMLWEGNPSPLHADVLPWWGGAALGKCQGSLWGGIYPGPPGTNLPKGWGLGGLGSTLSPLAESWPSPEAPFLRSVL